MNRQWSEVYAGGKFHRAKWRVLYSDGSVTRPLLKQEAIDLAKIHGAELLKIICPIDKDTLRKEVKVC